MTNQRHKRTGIARVVTAMIMVLLLGWFTISLPFVYAAQNASITYSADVDGDLDSEDCAPIDNTSEEKAPSGAGPVSEEYLHNGGDLLRSSILFLSHSRHSSSSEYISFHGEMLCPPPEIFFL